MPNRIDTVRAALESIDSDNPVDQACAEVLRAALAEVDDAYYDALGDEFPTPPAPSRILTVTPSGRAALKLAETIIAEGTRAHERQRTIDLLADSPCVTVAGRGGALELLRESL